MTTYAIQQLTPAEILSEASIINASIAYQKAGIEAEFTPTLQKLLIDKKAATSRTILGVDIDYNAFIQEIAAALFQWLKDYEASNKPKTVIGKIIKWITNLF